MRRLGVASRGLASFEAAILEEAVLPRRNWPASRMLFSRRLIHKPRVHYITQVHNVGRSACLHKPWRGAKKLSHTQENALVKLSRTCIFA